MALQVTHQVEGYLEIPPEEQEERTNFNLRKGEMKIRDRLDRAGKMLDVWLPA